MNDKFFKDFLDPLNLKNILEEKTRACDRFLDITERLNNRLDAQDLEETNQLLSERQELIHTIDRIDDKIRGTSPKTLLEGLKQFPDLKDHLITAEKNLMAIFEKTVVLDKNCVAKAKDWQNEIKEKLVGLRKGRKVLNQYIHSGGLQPRFMDIRK